MFNDPLTSGNPPERRLHQSVARHEDAERPRDLRRHIVVLAQNRPADPAAGAPGKVGEGVKAISASLPACLDFSSATTIKHVVCLTLCERRLVSTVS